VVTEAGWRTNLAPVADVYVRDGIYAITNYGADTILTVKRDPTVNFSRESFLRFASPWFPGVLADAQLRLQPVAASLPGTNAVALVTDDTWDETATTWNSKPVSGATLATWIPQAGVPVQISVAAAIQQDLPVNGFLSLRLYATNSTTDGKVDYASREAGAATAPQLSLFYTNAQPLSATQNFWVNVTAPQSPVLSGLQYVAGTFRMSVAGDGGPDYAVLTSTNLLTWANLFTTNGAPGAFVFGVTNSTTMPQQFYRVQLGP
jgi:hypothetical protein